MLISRKLSQERALGIGLDGNFRLDSDVQDMLEESSTVYVGSLLLAVHSRFQQIRIVPNRVVVLYISGSKYVLIHNSYKQ